MMAGRVSHPETAKSARASMQTDGRNVGSGSCWASGWLHGDAVIACAARQSDGGGNAGEESLWLSVVALGDSLGNVFCAKVPSSTHPKELRWCPSQSGGLLLLTERSVVVFSSAAAERSFHWVEMHRVDLPSSALHARWVGALSSSILLCFPSRLEVWTSSGQHGYVPPTMLRQIADLHPLRRQPDSTNAGHTFGATLSQDHARAARAAFAAGLENYRRRRAASLSHFYCTWMKVQISKRRRRRQP